METFLASAAGTLKKYHLLFRWVLFFIVPFFILEFTERWAPGLVTNPALIYTVFVVIIAIREGLKAGLLAAVLGTLYTGYFFSSPGQPFFTNTENLNRTAVGSLTLFALALMTGLLKQRSDKLAYQEIARLEKDKAYSWFMQAPVIVFILRAPNFVFEFVNPLGERLLGPQSVIGKEAWHIFPTLKNNPLVMQAMERALCGTVAVLRAIPITFRWEGRETEEVKYLDVLFQPLLAEDGSTEKILNVAVEVTEQVTSQQIREQAREQLEESEHRFRFVADHAPVLMWMTGPDGANEYFNKTWLEFTGRSLEEELRDAWTVGMHPDDQQRSRELFAQAARDKTPYTLEYRLRRKDGVFRHMYEKATPRFSKEGKLLGFIGSCIDLTDLKKAQEEIHHSAHHDTLTGLPNRKFFEEKFYEILESRSVSHSPFAVMFLDLDRFKQINDSFGHDTGDAVFREVAGRLTSVLPPEAMVARWGGDEMVALLPNISSGFDATRTADSFLKALNPIMRVQGHSLHISASIGIALYPDHGKDLATLQKSADAALYQAKQLGKNRFQVYQSTMVTKAFEEIEIENDLRHALEYNELKLHFQPMLELKTLKVHTVESLLRWNHRKRGLLKPGNFLKVAEETGLIVPIGAWVLDETCKQLKNWQAQGIFLVGAVNISAKQFNEESLVETVFSALERHELEAKYLELEITETLAMENTDRTRTILNRLKEKGVCITTDDFGTGYSSFAYLKRFPIHKLKIDKSFIRHCITDDQDSSIVRAIVSMAKSLHLKVVAEGTNVESQVNFLHSLGCDAIQGFYVSPPLPAADLAEWLSTRGASPVSRQME